MNARTKLSANGNIAIPEDVRRQLHWAEGTSIDVRVEKGEVRLRANGEGSGLDTRPSLEEFGDAARFGSGQTTMADLRALPPRVIEPQPIEAISRLSNEDILRVLLDDRH